MPVLSRQYNHDHSNLTKFTLQTVTIKRFGGTTANNTYVCKEISQEFYAELKALLQVVSEDITFDDTNYAFTIFGKTYKAVCYVLSSNANSLVVKPTTDYYNCVAPSIFSENSIDYNRCFKSMGCTSNTITSLSWVAPASGFQTNMWTAPSDKSATSYGLKVYYNTNFVAIQYISAKEEVVNLLTVMKGYLTDDNRVEFVYESPSPNNNYISTDDINTYFPQFAMGNVYAKYAGATSTSNFNNGYHQIWRKDDGTNVIPYPSTTGIPGCSHNLYMFGVNHILASDAKTYIPELASDIDAVVTKPLCLGGAITFDNLLMSDSSIGLNQMYNVNGSVYYCIGDDVQIANETAVPRRLMYPRFLLKV